MVTHTVPQDWLHEDAPFTFVTDGVESAITQAKAVAGEGWVGVAGPNVAQQALNAGLIDELRIYLVPVLLGEGIPFFEKLSSTPVMLEDPTVIEGVRVTHLIYRISQRRTTTGLGLIPGRWRSTPGLEGNDSYFCSTERASARRAI